MLVMLGSLGRLGLLGMLIMLGMLFINCRQVPPFGRDYECQISTFSNNSLSLLIPYAFSIIQSISTRTPPLKSKISLIRGGGGAALDNNF